MVSKNIEKAICRLTCGKDKATAFLISENQAITARHAIEGYYESGNKIHLEFLNLSNTPIVCEAIPVDIERSGCISLLNLDTEISSEVYLQFCDYCIEKDDDYETFGYPVAKWNLGERTISYVSRRIDDSMTGFYDWDVDLNHNSNIADFKGLSGAPLFINEMLVGVVLAESMEKGKAVSLGAVSIEKIADILLSLNVTIKEKVLDYDLNEIYEIDEDSKYLDAIFIAKLESADIYDHEDCQLEFFNADIAKSSIEGRGINTEIQQFTMLRHNLKSVWKTDHRTYKDEKDGNDLLAKVYHRVEDLCETTLKSDLPLSLMVKKGMLHQLADECKVGWTKNYRKRLQEYLAEKEQTND
ncbi:TPA: hypothetical protein ACTZ3T_001627 [Bacillus cereus]|uniref:hypothetical protein n=1 Tax=Bacillus sp. MB353a TaxID=1982041 RepID=UPI000B532E5C|nr:hypothetical protein [Bacillus sp. MB353a]OWW11636.1 hypothetical protein BUE63_04080 [Bacillus sp. MB353a]